MPDPVIPVDDEALNAIEHTFGGALVGELDDIELVGADYSLPQLLDFWAGYEESQEPPIGWATWQGRDVEVYDETNSPPTFRRDDLIQALITEIRRLRKSIAEREEQ